MTHDEAFLAAILEAPDDPTPRLVYADWCEENGKPDFAYALRWMLARGLAPAHLPQRKLWPWMWFRASPLGGADWVKREKRRHQPAIMPVLLFDLLPTPDPHYQSFRSWHEAVESLGLRLRILGDLYAIAGRAESG
jgi:uncharacterized protein (TIGR02996 family)